MERNFKKQMFDICNETVDLFSNSVDTTISENKFIFESNEEEQWSVSVIIDEDGSKKSRVGIHSEVDEDFDEYRLMDLLEQATRDGFPSIYLRKAV